MEIFIQSIPVWLLCLVIFVLRIGDVTLGTIRTITIVQGKLKTSMVLGFFELVIWVTAISQVLTRINESFYLTLFYAGGFTAGNAVGLLLEKKLAIGKAVLRIFSVKYGNEISESLRKDGQALTTFTGDGLSGPVKMIFIICPRKKIESILSRALLIDPKLSYSIDRANAWGQPYKLATRATGWRSVLKKK
jgi:uncharacterized protein YebE (UPF0316 family)